MTINVSSFMPVVELPICGDTLTIMTVDHTPPSRGEAEFDAFIERADRAQWWLNRNNLHLTAEYIVHEDLPETVTNIVDMLETPWSYTAEFVNGCDWEATEHEVPLVRVLNARLAADPQPITYSDPAEMWSEEEEQAWDALAAMHDQRDREVAEAYVDEDVQRGDR